MKFCMACGTALDDDGICTNEKCKRRKLQLALEDTKDKAGEAKTAAESTKLQARATAKSAYLGESKRVKGVLKIAENWI